MKAAPQHVWGRWRPAIVAALILSQPARAQEPDASARVASKNPPASILDRWNWSQARLLDNVTDKLSALHPLPTGTFLGLDDDGFMVHIKTLVGPAPSQGWPRTPLEGDLEGLCSAPNGDLLILLEDASELRRLHGPSQDIVHYTLDPKLPRGGQGYEGLAWVTQPGGRHTLWLGHQGRERIYVVDAPTESRVPQTLQKLEEIDLEDEARGLLTFPALAGVLAILDDSQTLCWLDLSGEPLAHTPWPAGSEDLEGLAVGPFGALFLTQDGGGIWHVPLTQFPSRQNHLGWVARRGEQVPSPTPPQRPTTATLAPGSQAVCWARTAPEESSKGPRPLEVVLEQGPTGRALTWHGSPPRIPDQTAPQKASPPERIALFPLDLAHDKSSAQILLWRTSPHGSLCLLNLPERRLVRLIAQSDNAPPQQIGSVQTPVPCTSLRSVGPAHAPTHWILSGTDPLSGHSWTGHLTVQIPTEGK